MNRLEIADYTGEFVSIKIEDYENTIQISFFGEIDMQDPESLFLPYFENIHQKIVDDCINEVVLNFQNLNFLNSSGIKVIIKWIQIALILPEEKKYKFKILASSKVPWQANSLKLLSMLSQKLIEIIVI